MNSRSENPTFLSRSDVTLLAIAALITGAFYSWSLSPDPGDAGVRHVSHKYFAWQADGWLAGQLDLPRAAPAGLLALPDPYDPGANLPFRMGGTDGVHDLSLYKGKLYLYWGPAPTLVAFLPWRVITGKSLPAAWASWTFAFGAWVACALLVARTARKHFPSTPPGVLFAAFIALAACSWAAVVLRRASVWEVPIFAACFFGALAWWLVAECGWAPRSSQWRWLAAASLAWGFAVGSRPIWIVASGVLLVPLWLERARWREMDFRRLLLAAALPFGLCVLGLLAHNAARFGNPLEFGQRWQLAATRVEDARLFAPEYIGFNLRAYLLSMPRLVTYFPFIVPGPHIDPPKGHFGTEFVYGLLVTLPWLWLAPLALWCRNAAAVVLPAAITALCLLAMLVTFAGVTARYELEIALPLAMLAVLGLLALEARAGKLRWLWRTGWLAALIVSISVACGASCQFMDMYAYSKPAAYQALARRANRLAVQLGWSPHEATQAVELTVTFPTNTPPGRQEALVASGTEASLSLVLAEYIDAEQMRFIFFISGQNWGTSPLRLDRTAPHTLRIELGGMLPPATHPFWKNTPPAEIARRRLRLSFSVDGQNVSTELGPQPEPVDASPRIGAISGHSSDRYLFTGKILSQRIVRLAAP